MSKVRRAFMFLTGEPLYLHNIDDKDVFISLSKDARIETCLRLSPGKVLCMRGYAGEVYARTADGSPAEVRCSNYNPWPED